MQLYPVTLEKMGLLNNSFGSHPLNNPGNNWTMNGYWIGSWRDSFPLDIALPLPMRRYFCIMPTKMSPGAVVLLSVS